MPWRRRNTTIISTAADAIAFAENATVTVRNPIDPTKPVSRQIQLLAGQIEAISNDLQAIRQKVNESESAQRSQAQHAEAAAAQAVSALEVRERLDAFTDLSVALGGILITATGIVLGMVYDGRFSWLPWG